jgi:CheY-like chemotaxis protein
MNSVIAWKEKNIIRLDDHQIVLDGFTNWCQREHPEITIKNFTDPGKVFLFIVSALTRGEKIDLFITDFAHGSLNGYEMSKVIRVLEGALNGQQMPILLLTQYGNNVSPIKEGLEEGIFTRYLSLGAGAEETIMCMEEMMDANLE